MFYVPAVNKGIRNFKVWDGMGHFGGKQQLCQGCLVGKEGHTKVYGSQLWISRR